MNGTIDLYGEQQQGDYSLDRIAEEAGVSAATIANHFGSKYEVLKAAYERLLSPLVDTIVEASKAGVYQPDDGVQELVRYVYTATLISQKHRALTTAMIKAYFELPPGRFIDFGVADYQDKEQREPLSAYLAEGMQHVFQVPPLAPVPFGPGGNLRYFSFVNACDALLLSLYRSPQDMAAEGAAFEVCRQLLNMRLHDDAPRDIQERMKRVTKPS